MNRISYKKILLFLFFILLLLFVLFLENNQIYPILCMLLLFKVIFTFIISFVMYIIITNFFNTNLKTIIVVLLIGNVFLLYFISYPLTLEQQCDIDYYISNDTDKVFKQIYEKQRIYCYKYGTLDFFRKSYKVEY